MDGKTMIQLDGIQVVRNGTMILDDVSWSLGAGEMAVILGANGSGKSTLMRVIAGYEWPGRGRVSVGGSVYGACDLRQLRRRIALVDPGLPLDFTPGLTAHQVAVTGCFSSLGLYDSPDAMQWSAAARALARVGLSDRLNHLFTTLSTGERRRCLIARALVCRPMLMILDEPTAGLDMVGREALLGLLEALHGQPDAPSLVLVTHHVEEITGCVDRLTALVKGRVVADGVPGELLNAELLSRVMGTDVDLEEHGGRFWARPVAALAWRDGLDRIEQSDEANNP